MSNITKIIDRMFLNIFTKLASRQHHCLVVDNDDLTVDGCKVAWRSNPSSTQKTFTLDLPVTQAISCRFAENVLASNSSRYDLFFVCRFSQYFLSRNSPKCLCVLQSVSSGQDILEV